MTRTVADLVGDLPGILGGEGLCLPLAPFVVRVRSRLPVLAEALSRLYADYPLAETVDCADFCVRIDAPAGLRRWWRPQVLFWFEERAPFKPLPRSQAYPMLEWGLNWCVGRHIQDYLIVHSAVLARGDLALLLPGDPGAGKSTLCADLMLGGWRLLSDELALIDPADLSIHPLVRPVSLKDGSIELIRARHPEAVFGPEARDTAKGTVIHVRPSPDSVARAADPARPRWVVMPRYEPGAGLHLNPLPAGAVALYLARHAFNYPQLGVTGFETVARLAEACRCLELRYDDLDRARAALDRLVAGAGA